MNKVEIGLIGSDFKFPLRTLRIINKILSRKGHLVSCNEVQWNAFSLTIIWPQGNGFLKCRVFSFYFPNILGIAERKRAVIHKPVHETPFLEFTATNDFPNSTDRVRKSLDFPTWASAPLDCTVAIHDDFLSSVLPHFEYLEVISLSNKHVSMRGRAA